MNKCQLIGRVTKNIEIKKTASGHSVTTFTLAINRRTKEDETDFINCQAWNKTAELLEKYVSKGNRLGVCGHIQTRNYDDKDGKKVYVTEIIVDEIEFLESKNDSAPKESTPVQTSDEYVGELDIDSDDLPF